MAYFYYQFRNKNDDSLRNQYNNTCAGAVTSTSFNSKYLLAFIPKKTEVEEFIDEYLLAMKEIGFEFERLADDAYIHGSLTPESHYIFKIDYPEGTHGRKYLATYSVLRYLYRRETLVLARNFSNLRKCGLELIPAFYWAHYGCSFSGRNEYSMGGYDMFKINTKGTSIHLPLELRKEIDFDNNSIIYMLGDNYKTLYSKAGTFGSQYIVDANYCKDILTIEELNFKGKYDKSFEVIENLKYNPKLKTSDNAYSNLIKIISS